MPRPISYAVFCLKKKSGDDCKSAGQSGGITGCLCSHWILHTAIQSAADLKQETAVPVVREGDGEPNSLYLTGDPHDLHSFPTRRSSDLTLIPIKSLSICFRVI